MFLIDNKIQPITFLERLTLNQIGMFSFDLSKSAIRLLERKCKKIKTFWPKKLIKRYHLVIRLSNLFQFPLFPTADFICHGAKAI